ncbi:hypothetical protein LUZ61_010334 [Rhynchospora tenuis]|uniref:RRM domain-containing protein n=1 Tax=Rhynchospora tenuis TaxID=198213 RepID=A0AAD6EZ98_9POAL|nr:hypothetical protein LUZ61_010334 [Rhynchospora tenuis]
MKPVFCGNLDYDVRYSEIERAFSRYGKIERIDMKSGYAFVYFFDERDADDAIRALDNTPFGSGRRRLTVEWSKQGERGPGRDKPPANTKPTKTLFVIHFDPVNTRVRDVERHFEPYGKILNVRIRRNFAFVQFETQEEATKALEATHNSKLLDRIVSVEYAFRDDGEPGDRYDSPRRGGGGGYGGKYDEPYRRSISPDYRRPRASPDYGRRRSPVYDHYGGHSAYDRPRSPDYGYRSPGYGRYRSRSPIRRSRT